MFLCSTASLYVQNPGINFRSDSSGAVHLALWNSLWLGPGAHWLGWLTRVSGSTRLCQPSAGLQYTLPCSLLSMGVGEQTQVLMFTWQTLSWDHLLSSTSRFLCGISQANLKNKGTRITKTLLKKREHLLFLEMGKGDALSTLWLWPRNLLPGCHCCWDMKRVNECAHVSVSLPLSSRVLSCDCLSWPTDLGLPVLP